MKRTAAKTAAIDLSAVSKAVFLIIMTLAVYMLVIAPAGAQAVQGAPNPLCGFINGFAFGNFAKGIATIGILAVGVGATLGKVSWQIAVMVAVGIGVLFGSSVLAAYLIDNSGNPNYVSLAIAC